MNGYQWLKHWIKTFPDDFYHREMATFVALLSRKAIHDKETFSDDCLHIAKHLSAVFASLKLIEQRPIVSDTTWNLNTSFSLSEFDPALIAHVMTEIHQKLVLLFSVHQIQY